MTGVGDPIATFLTHALPWSAGTYVNIEAFEWMPDPGEKPEAGKGKLGPRKASRSCQDLNEAIGFARWCDRKGWEVYVRMASGKNPGTAKATKTGGTVYRAMGHRNNAAELVSHYIDVDVKRGAHGSTQEAVGAVQAMCTALGWPPPTFIVLSGGGGFHAHWVDPKPTTVATWDAFAVRLQEACRQHGVLADHNVTVNAVCLLRIPGTHNRKYGDPRQVLLEMPGGFVSREALEAALPIVTMKNSASAPPGAHGGPSPDPAIFPARTLVDDPWAKSWTAGIEVDAFTLDEVATGCPYVAATIADGGIGQSQSLWFAAGHIAIFTAGWVGDFGKRSERHACYKESDALTMFERVLKAKQENDFGWPRCRTLHLAGAKDCAGCPHLAEDRSPLNFAVRAKVTPAGNNPQGTGENGDNSNNNIPKNTI